MQRCRVRWKLFYRGHKRAISSMQSFTKKISGRKGKDSAEIFPSSEYWWTLQLKCDPVLNVKLPHVCKFCSNKLRLSSNLLLPSNLLFVWRHSYFVFPCCQATLRCDFICPCKKICGGCQMCVPRSIDPSTTKKSRLKTVLGRVLHTLNANRLFSFNGTM